ncbi:MAG TPA: AMP-binding protein, partial [Micromonosporaceae bacterium]|nr:AMP-binding protein [Micromonosporaceae bacterium]
MVGNISAPGGRGDGLPVTAGQSGIWFGQQLDPGSAAYNIGLYVDVEGPLDVAVFERAVRRCLEECDGLRARVGEHDGRLWQWVQPLGGWELPRVDLRGEAEPERAARVWMRADMARPLVLGRPPHYAFALLRVARERHWWYWKVHHVVADGAGTAVFLGRVAAVYAALAQGREPAGPALGSVRLLVEEEAAYRASERYAADRAYWRRRYADRPEPVSLAGRAGAGAGAVHRRAVVLGPGVAEGLGAAARRAGAGWSRALVAALAAYVYRMTGVRDVVLGFAVSGRVSREARSVVGMVSNLLPVRLAVGPGTTLAELTARAAAEVDDVLAHQRYRHEDLRRDLGVVGTGRRLHGPTVNIVPAAADLRVGALRWVGHGLSTGPVEDLTLGCYGSAARPGGLRVDINANAALFDRPAVAALAGRLTRLLGQVAADPQVRVGDLELLGPAERERVLAGWNATGRAVPAATLPRLFAAQAGRTPDAPALVCAGVTLTYAELAARVGRLAGVLAGCGVGPERLVAVALPPSAELVVALLAVLEAGGAYLPVDLDNPAGRIAAMLDDADPVLVVTSTEVAGRLPGQGMARLVLGDAGVEERIASCPAQRLADVALDPHHPAYMIYTSGSTGRPKGVVVSHAAVVNLLSWMQGEYGLDATDRMLHKTPVGFDPSVGELFWPLTVGATLVVAAPGGHRDPAYLAELIRTERVTSVQFVPSTLQAFLDGAPAEACAGLRRVFCG